MSLWMAERVSCPCGGPLSVCRTGRHEPGAQRQAVFRRAQVHIRKRLEVTCCSSAKEEVPCKASYPEGLLSSSRPGNPRDKVVVTGRRFGQFLNGWQNMFGMLQSPYDNQILSLALPALLTLAADPLLSIVDTIFVGRLGFTELAALGVNTALYSLAFFLFNFLATTTTPLVASAVSMEDREKAGQVTIQGLLLCGLLGVLLYVALTAGADWLLEVMGASGEMLAPAKEYLLARSFAAPAAMVCLVGQGVSRGLQDMKTPLIITLMANAVNFVLDPILIFGFGMGVRGAALATAVAECGSALAYFVLLWRERQALGLDCTLESALRRARSNYFPFLQAGGTVLLRTFVLLATKTYASVVSTHLGSVNIAAHQVLAQLWLLHSLMTDSLAVAAQSLVAVSLGQGNVKQARGISDRLLQMGVALGLLMAVSYGITCPVLPGVFTNDNAVIAAVYNVAPIAFLVLPVSSAAYVFDGIFVGAEDFEFLAWSMAFAAAFVCGALFLVEPLGWGLLGVWWCQSGMMFLRAAVQTWRYQQCEGPIPFRLQLIDKDGVASQTEKRD